MYLVDAKFVSLVCFVSSIDALVSKNMTTNLENV